MANHLHSNSYTYTAFTYSEKGQLPFLLSNFGSGDVLTPERKNGEAYLDRIIPNLAEYYNGEENFPTVHIIAVISNEKLEKLFDFLRRILTLSYPKEKIYISIVLQGDNKGNHKKELEKMLQKQEVKKYKRIQVLSTGENYYKTYQKAW
ncbi:hypothetical protein Anas_12140 [Armadillidium nasatum]|uniref:Uncharacterized protein n=1 Tax=Armadillidium nasatum TaxID=96803 RepID=A0A5N5SM38_9CRUS|nr:hypothetical protein Anas_12140 [Armadillidium nasatum]